MGSLPSQTDLYGLIVSERRHAFASGTDYCGKAPGGSATSAAVWTITRLVIASDGTPTITKATPVAWDNYLTATYS